MATRKRRAPRQQALSAMSFSLLQTMIGGTTALIAELPPRTTNEMEKAMLASARELLKLLMNRIQTGPNIQTTADVDADSPSARLNRALQAAAQGAGSTQEPAPAPQQPAPSQPAPFAPSSPFFA